MELQHLAEVSRNEAIVFGHRLKEGKLASADAGYCSDANLAALEGRGIDAYVAPGRAKHASAGEGGGARIAAMREKIKAGGHGSPYRLRKQLPEPVFGQIKQARGFCQFLLRGVEKVAAEWGVVPIDRANQDKKPFLVWFNPSRMHIWTRLEPSAIGKTGYGVYPDGMVEQDGQVGQLLKKLDDLGIAKDTIVIDTSDNGAEVFSWPDGGTTPFRGEKNSNWEGAYRAPAMVRWFRCEHRKRGALGDALQHGADFAFAFRGRSAVRPYRGQRDYLLGLIRRTPDITRLAAALRDSPPKTTASTTRLRRSSESATEAHALEVKSDAEACSKQSCD